MDIILKNLRKVYNHKTVLDIKSLYLKEGKVYGIIGPNGAGKSTMLRIIAGLEEATMGKVFYDDKKLIDAVIKKITYMSQRPYLFRKSVTNNISYPLKLRKIEKEVVDKRVKEIMREFNVFDLKNQLATSLSGGESQKVALARALIFKPEVLLLDEPTANIDPNSIEIIEKAIMKRNKEKNMTTIIITHNMGQAKRLCDEIIFIKDGFIKEHGKTDDIIFRPKNHETKRFLSLYTM